MKRSCLCDVLDGRSPSLLVGIVGAFCGGVIWLQISLDIT
jgi:hypothetical protein